MTIRFHETALRDLEHIRDPIAEADPRIAEIVLVRIDHSISVLDTFPDLGRPGLVPGTREKPVPRTPFVVVYEKVGATELWILTIVHWRQHYPPDE